ncbi:MAG: sulfur carrier protein ThiS [Pseudomonadales bacterium]|nr:sulfur carrier protein ThiS [Pseudomonadales bacterium]
MIEVSLNNETQNLKLGATVTELLAACGFEDKKVAVAINTEFVPRSSYDSHIVNSGDAIDVLAAVQGG